MNHHGRSYAILARSYQKEDHPLDGFVSLGMRCSTLRVLPLRNP